MHVTPTEACSLLNHNKIECLGHVLSMGYVYVQHAQYVILLAVNSDQFSNFMELHTLTQAARSYTLLLYP